MRFFDVELVGREAAGELVGVVVVGQKTVLKRSVLACSSSTIFPGSRPRAHEGWAAGVEEDFI